MSAHDQQHEDEGHRLMMIRGPEDPNEHAAGRCELLISGHVEHQPEGVEDPDGVCVCRFVLTHITEDPVSGHWLVQFYDVEARGQQAEDFIVGWTAEQAVTIVGRLDYEVCHTPTGPVPHVQVLAEHITTAPGHLAKDPETGDAGYRLLRTPAGPVPTTSRRVS